MKNLNGFKTEAAYVAFIIKNELKAKFPGVKFSVRSETFSMGNSINVSYEIGKHTPPVDAVEAVVKKYQAGRFDGMTDSYEYTNKTDGPTVKYASVNANYPKAVVEKVNASVPRGSWPEVYRDAYKVELENYLAA